jgi:hypothetical protein
VQKFVCGFALIVKFASATAYSLVAQLIVARWTMLIQFQKNHFFVPTTLVGPYVRKDIFYITMMGSSCQRSAKCVFWYSFYVALRGPLPCIHTSHYEESVWAIFFVSTTSFVTGSGSRQASVFWRAAGRLLHPARLARKDRLFL